MQRVIKRKELLLISGVALIMLVMLACAGPAEEEATPTAMAEEATPTAMAEEATPTAMAEEATVAPSVGEPKYGGVLRLVGYDPVGWDSLQSGSYKTHTILNMIYSKLAQLSHGPESSPTDFTPVPALAESWEISDDGLVYTFHLHKGVKFHNKPPVNGRELVAEDVKWTLERILNSTFESMKVLYGEISAIECPDKYTVKFTLSQPSAPLLGLLANYVCAEILAEEAGKQDPNAPAGRDFTMPETAIGTGPFMYESYQPNVMSVFKRNPDYYKKDKAGRQLPYVDEVKWIIVADASTRLAAVRAGNLDISSVGRTELPSLQASNPELTYYEYMGVGTACLYYRVDEPPFDDVRVRQAVALAFDRQTFIDAMYLGAGTPMGGPVPPCFQEWQLPLDQLGPAAKYFEYDVAEAKRLLAEAGYPDGFETTASYTTAYGDIERLELIVDMLSRIGIKTNINLQEYAAYLATTSRGDYSGMAYGQFINYTEVDGYVYHYYYSTSAKNRSHLNDPKIDELLDKQRAAVTTAERKKYLDEFQRYFLDQCYVLYPPRATTTAIWQPWIKNYMPKGGFDQGGLIEAVWIDKG